ncbi:universal stress protein [Psychrobacter lutiphocae]|uniref:universal stress protein n=1 Tax=Psychrobacter lutiphocae TaxID=540500 RepID=UPI000374AC26|nr:universal stress protein [Psychrobacter lutiphocae]
MPNSDYTGTNSPNNLSKANQSILACIDGSNVTQSVCDYAAWYASQLNLSISLLHVIEVPKSKRHDLSGTIGMGGHKSLMQEIALLDEKKARIANKHGDTLLKNAKSYITQSKANTQANVAIQAHLRHSKLLPAIEHLLKNTHAIILGRRGKDHQQGRINIGSQIETVVRAADRPIILCSEPFHTPDSFLMAFDGSATAKKAVDLLCHNQVAKTLKGHLVLVGSKDSDRETALYKAQLQMRQVGMDITAHVINSQGSGNKGIVNALINFRQTHDISVFVIGAYGHSKFRQFFVGSTTTKLLAQSTVPVILLR